MFRCQQENLNWLQIPWAFVVSPCCLARCRFWPHEASSFWHHEASPLLRCSIMQLFCLLQILSCAHPKFSADKAHRQIWNLCLLSHRPLRAAHPSVSCFDNYLQTLPSSFLPQTCLRIPCAHPSVSCQLSVRTAHSFPSLLTLSAWFSYSNVPPRRSSFRLCNMEGKRCLLLTSLVRTTA